MSVLSTLSCTLAAAAPDADAIHHPQSDLANARFIDATGADAELFLDAPPGLFPQLTVVRTAGEQFAAPALLLLPYSDDLVIDWRIEDEHQIGVFTQDFDGTWSWAPANVDANANMLYVGADSGAAWAAGPPWMMRPWQRRAILGADFVPGERNVLVLHGWNSDPWEGCTLDLMAGIAPSYDNIAVMAYPSALDITANGNWLRDQAEQRWPGTSFDIVGFSEGGLVARAAIEPHAWNDHTPIGAELGRLVTIATPHTGVLPAAHFSVLNDEAARQMRPASDFLRALNADPRHDGIRYQFLAGDTGAGHDGVVPVDSALGRGALAPDDLAVLPLLHSADDGARRLPCDTSVYETAAEWQ
jgi:hypothetical protein